MVTLQMTIVKSHSLIKSHEILKLKSTIPDNTVITILKHAFEMIGLNLSNVQL